MDEITQSILAKIYNATKNTSDDYAVSVSIGVRSDKRNDVCYWLEANGYITNVNYIGQDKIQCQITDKAKRYFTSI